MLPSRSGQFCKLRHLGLRARSEIGSFLSVQKNQKELKVCKAEILEWIASMEDVGSVQYPIVRVVQNIRGLIESENNLQCVGTE